MGQAEKYHSEGTEKIKLIRNAKGEMNFQVVPKPIKKEFSMRIISDPM